MKILLDHCVPRPLRTNFPGHNVHTAYERGWAALKNGVLLSTAETDGFDVLITADQNLRHQQSMAGRTIAVLILAGATNRVADLSPLAARALTKLDSMQPGTVVIVSPGDAGADLQGARNEFCAC